MIVFPSLTLMLQDTVIDFIDIELTIGFSAVEMEGSRHPFRMIELQPRGLEVLRECPGLYFFDSFHSIP